MKGLVKSNMYGLFHNQSVSCTLYKPMIFQSNQGMYIYQPWSQLFQFDPWHLRYNMYIQKHENNGCWVSYFSTIHREPPLK